MDGSIQGTGMACLECGYPCQCCTIAGTPGLAPFLQSQRRASPSIVNGTSAQRYCKAAMPDVHMFTHAQSRRGREIERERGKGHTHTHTDTDTRVHTRTQTRTNTHTQTHIHTTRVHTNTDTENVQAHTHTHHTRTTHRKKHARVRTYTSVYF